ncbi:conserved hypothetical protein [Ricinus communis]|uniref:Uncharacterized protein n=1 Tax=Ricinus communis TaxID=3988 RepID=B9TCZ4_RICCO|nr:conserved hypothetical protein [Ricinus communis]
MEFKIYQETQGPKFHHGFNCDVPVRGDLRLARECFIGVQWAPLSMCEQFDARLGQIVSRYSRLYRNALNDARCRES